MPNTRIPLFDLHCDTPRNIEQKKFNHIKPEYLHRQNYRGAVFAHFVYPEVRYPFVEAVTLLSTTISYIARMPRLAVVTSYRALDDNKVNIILGVEGGHIFDNTFKQIEALYNQGVRIFTLTWNNSNRLAHSAGDADNKGITKKCKEFLKELKNYDVIIDLSHASTRTVLDVCAYSENQVIASHSCVRALKPSLVRNIDDRALAAIVQRGGVIGVNFCRYHLGAYHVTEHIDYIKSTYGIDYVAIGSDFDGIDDAVISGPTGIRRLEQGLMERGYTRAEIQKIFSENFLRVFKKSSR